MSLYLRTVFLLAAALVSFSSLAINVNINFRAESKFNDIKNEIEELLESQAPEDILVLIDVHGVLCNESIPTDYLPNGQATLRSGAKDLVDYLLSKNIMFLAASAWDEPEQVIKDLVDIGLADAFQVKNQTDDIIRANFKGRLGLRDVTFHHYSVGRVAGIGIAEEHHGFHKLKAMAPLVNANSKNMAIKSLIFIDDAKSNVTAFGDWFKVCRPSLPCYQSTDNVKLFWLSPYQAPVEDWVLLTNDVNAYDIDDGYCSCDDEGNFNYLDSLGNVTKEPCAKHHGKKNNANG